jgi:hypothetical protein
MADNTTQQIEVLTETYRMLISEGDMVRADLKTKIIAAQGVMEDGTEITAVANEGGSQNAQVMYPKEVVLAAALTAWKETDPDEDTAAAAAANDLGAVHMDFSHTRLET